MNNTWVVSIKTSLPDVCYNSGELKTKIYLFDCFESARSAVRAILKKLSFSKNTMFDGDGKITHLSKYIESAMDSDDEEYDDDVLTSSKLEYIHELFESIFKGEDVSPNLSEGDCTDWMIAYRYENGVISFYGDDDGPCNGYDPVLKTNMFTMKEENNYFLYIDDLLGQDEATSELYIDLMKAETFVE